MIQRWFEACFRGSPKSSLQRVVGILMRESLTFPFCVLRKDREAPGAGQVAEEPALLRRAARERGLERSRTRRREAYRSSSDRL